MKEKDTLLEKEKDKPKNLHLDFTCNYREKNNVNYFLGFFIYRREIASKKNSALKAENPYVYFTYNYRRKNNVKNYLGFLYDGRRTNFPRKIPYLSRKTSILILPLIIEGKMM